MERLTKKLQNVIYVLKTISLSTMTSKININISEEKLSLRGKTLFQTSRLTVWENGKQNSGLVNFVPE